MKKLIIFLLLAAMLAVPASAAEDGRAVIGADLGDAEIAQVYELFGIERGAVTELTLTNAQEREYLEGLVPEEQLGTRSISCVLVTPQSGSLSVETHNISWCSEGMYLSAMTTAGIEDVAVVAASPFEVSGTAALAGIFLAYEDMTGEKLSGEAKLAAAAELTTTAELTDELGGDILSLVTELKLSLGELQGLSDEELVERIDELAGNFGLTLNDYQREKLTELCRSLEKLDPDAIGEKVEELKDTLEKLGEIKDKTVSFWEALANFFKAIVEFFSKIASIFAG